jgi:16S rRNA (cytosine967-C5)-methyltransferase
MKISPARTAAFDILLRVETEKAFTSVLLPQYEDKLSPADRALCHELVLGTLRRQIWLDRLIDTLTGRKKLDIEVRIALRLGIYQLNFLDKVPPYSAINESVNLVQRARKTSAKPFVNAVLCRTAKDQIYLSYADDIERLSVETSHPRWLIEKWIDDLGQTEAAEIAEANNRIGSTAFRVIDESNEDIAAVIETARPSANVDGCYIVDKPDARLYALAEKGAVYIQDEASQMTARSIVVPDGGRFLDVCAAPGGKTGLIARRGPTSLIVAGDLYWSRVQFLRDNCRRQKAENVSVLHYDAEKALPFAYESFDAVFVDAPCSGTGTIRRNPEIRYLLRPEDLSELALKQLRILTEASKLVKPGGVLTYSTCSLEKEENESVCGQVLASQPSFRPLTPRVPGRFVTNDGFARTFPHRDDMDGFFIACFERA